MIAITTGRLWEKERLEREGWTFIDVTVKSAGRGARSLTPTWEMVMGYKRGRLSEEEYTSQYKAILQKSQQEHRSRWIKTIENHKKVAFGCMCPVGDFCHRLLLAEEFVTFAVEEMNMEDVYLIPETTPHPPMDS